VLCRILTELKLLMTPVGVIVLSAGVGNDVVGEFYNSTLILVSVFPMLTFVGQAGFCLRFVSPSSTLETVWQLCGSYSPA
jgi:Kef-type K+ transport system membrane component KefB